MNRGVVVLLGLGFGTALVLAAPACGADGRGECDPQQLLTDNENCGVCGNACDDNYNCVEGICIEEACSPGTVEDCYSGLDVTLGVGLCAGGQRTCNNAGTWGICVGEVTPHQEVCGNGLDENCNGEADENVDLDGDGYTTCDGDCCEADTQCSGPALVNPGAFETLGNNVDDDCDGVPDNALANCDTGLLSNSADPLDYVRAMDICQMTTESSIRWGLIDAKLTLADGGTTPPAAGGRAIRNGFGTNMAPQRGDSVVVISSGIAADMTDTNPSFGGLDAYHTVAGIDQSSSFPADWLAANGGVLPNAPGCPPPNGNVAQDPVMLTFRVRVPSNAKSFSVKLNFISKEFPEYVCTQFNDTFIILLDSAWADEPANPADKNLAFYTNPTTMERTPVGVNLAHDNTGLYTMCVNGTGGCSGNMTFPITTCLDSVVGLLDGTGFDTVTDWCSPGQLNGGGTGWLTTSGNVVGGEIMTLRIAIWDTSDHVFDSTAIIDDFQWSVDAAEPGTVIE
jgi:hypothetical protein